ncbi:hypothetical protein [Noviherbaspirillum denitrificans]|uniref:WYL domain-containing protein n=1 Tax=Noviherbaspirillum denitrificans TaxID=1968433 RepID=A0A254TIV2_9BURK|nr:hypothetical protein [Noviherbaspirillum denitrificans]OWW20493.1 hypothetical protein AYR66_14360 [Noviherbaspirillum denitrificans]
MEWQFFHPVILFMNEVIVSAIRDRKILAMGERRVEPHAYGLDGVGKAHLLCYDVSAPAAEGRRGWAVLPVPAQMDVAVTAERFGRARMGYRRDDTGLCSVVEQV